MSKAIVGPVRFSFCHVFTPHKFDGDEGEGKYSVTVIIPKSDKKTVALVNKALQEAMAEAKDKKWGGKIPAASKLALPLRDGDEDNEKDAEEIKGCYYMRAKSSQKPGVVDKDRQPITDPAEFYSGCYGFASLVFIGYDHAGNKGVGCYLNNVMKTKEGERLGGGASADEDFADVEFEDDDLV